MGRETTLPAGQFDNVIRFLKSTGLDRVRSIERACRKQLEALGTKTDKAKAIAGIPDGSDHLDTGSLITWIQGVQDAPATAQLVAIDATCHWRLDG